MCRAIQVCSQDLSSRNSVDDFCSSSVTTASLVLLVAGTVIALNIFSAPLSATHSWVLIPKSSFYLMTAGVGLLGGYWAVRLGRAAVMGCKKFGE